MKNKKDLRRTARKILKLIFNRKTMTKALVVFMSLALIASYVLPYILQSGYWKQIAPQDSEAIWLF